MRIEQLTAWQVPIALKKPVRHASHERHENETLIIRCQLDDGSVGWGEGLPRVYVTGESTASVWRHLQSTDFSVLAGYDISDPLHAIKVLDEFRLADVLPDPGIAVRECFGNSVRCALDTAILDACCRSSGCTVSEVLARVPGCSGVIQPRDEVFYSGAITSMTARKQRISAWKMRLFGFHQVKVKVGAGGIDDAECLHRVRRIVGPGVDLRLDANEAWRCEDVLTRMDDLIMYGPTCLEQPVRHADVAGLAEVRSRLAVPIMLDESLCCAEDAERAVKGGWCDYFNIRLSKCGGLIRSLRLAVFAKEHGIGIQLGCQVGETGILSAAGRHFACTVNGIRYLEGSYDRFLVRETLIRENLTIRRRGRGRRLKKPGLGITVNEKRVRRLAVRTLQLFPANKSG